MPFLVGHGSLLISGLKMLLPLIYGGLDGWSGLQFFSFRFSLSCYGIFSYICV